MSNDQFRALVMLAGATYHGTLEEVLSTRRWANLVDARHTVAWVLRRRGLSYPSIGRRLSRDHTTAMYGVRRIEADPKLKQTALGIEAALLERLVAVSRGAI